MIYKKRSLIPVTCRKNLYFSLIYSCVIYGIFVFESANNSVLAPLLISCNRVLRALQGKPRHYPVSLLYSNFNTLLICLILYLLDIVYRCNNIKSSIPSVIHSMFVLNDFVHHFNTKSRFIIS